MAPNGSIRKGHDSLAAMVKNELRKDPFTGILFVFRAKQADRLKVLYWVNHRLAVGPRDNGARRGMVMACKRLADRGLAWPAVTDGLIPLSHAQFEALFAG